jgi:transcriptional antiterminator
MNTKKIRLKEIYEPVITTMFENYHNGNGKPKDERIILELRVNRNPLTGQFLLQYNSIKDASKRLKISKSQIINQLKGRTKHVRGLIFEYVK